MKVVNFVFEIMEEASASLRNSLEVYWPADAKNDPPERNLSMHFCHVLVLSRKGFFIYPEADHPHKKENKIQGIDILAISPDKSCCFACEFKAYTGESMTKSSKDIERVTSFHLNGNSNPNIFGHNRINTVSKCANNFGIVAGLLWRPGNDTGNISTKTKQIEFDNKVKHYNGRVADPILGIRSEAGGEVRGSYYLYHATFGKLNQRAEGRSSLVHFLG